LSCKYDNKCFAARGSHISYRIYTRRFRFYSEKSLLSDKSTRAILDRGEKNEKKKFQ
jgi:hypothetical protein